MTERMTNKRSNPRLTSKPIDQVIGFKVQPGASLWMQVQLLHKPLHANMLAKEALRVEVVVGRWLAGEWPRGEGWGRGEGRGGSGWSGGGDNSGGGWVVTAHTGDNNIVHNTICKDKGIGTKWENGANLN